LEPQLGVMQHNGKALKIADIPGLIEGAHRGRGLGDLFLKHIQRTEVLVFVLGLSETDIRPEQVFIKLREELSEFDPGLLNKRYIIVANKIDLPEAALRLKTLRSSLKTEEILPVSLLDKTGIDKVKAKIASCF
jgi:GTPase